MKTILALHIALVAMSAVANDAPRANWVGIPFAGAQQFLIPVAGSTPGANGTFFRSDITLVNLTTHDQPVSLQWLPEGGGTILKTIAIPKQSGIHSADFVAEYFNTTGLGSIIVTATSTEGIDITGAIYVASRIWTRQPGTAGTTSQSFPAVTMGALSAGLFNTSVAALFSATGADNPSNYRENVGIVNVSANPQTFVVSLSGTTSSFVVNLPAMSMQQISVGSGLSPTQSVAIENTTPAATRSNSWIAYGSTIDNTTGDAWSEIAVPGVVP